MIGACRRFGLLSVTSEVAGSSPVVPASVFNHFQAFLLLFRTPCVSSCVTKNPGAELHGLPPQHRREVLVPLEFAASVTSEFADDGFGHALQK